MQVGSGWEVVGGREEEDDELPPAPPELMNGCLNLRPGCSAATDRNKAGGQR